MLKRALDVLLSAAVTALTLPLWPIVGLLIKLDSPGPVLYRAVRVGKDGHLFTLLKFRSMVEESTISAPRVTHKDDDRITRVGRVLRDLKIDELPQFINVIKGDLSLVGPRPEDPRYVAHYSDDQRRVLSVRPGIVSPAVIKYRHEEVILARAAGEAEEAYVSRILPDKLRMDLDYVEQRSLRGDLRILATGLRSIFSDAPPEADPGTLEG